MGIYLDNAATTMTSQRAAARAIELMTAEYGNPSSSHTMGRAARSVLEESRKIIADAINANQNEIYFTSGGTEGDNWAVLSGAKLNRRAGGHIISSGAEHDAVLKCLERLEALGYAITRLAPEKDGSVSAEAVIGAVRPDTCLVSLMTVNNETGAISDISKISHKIREKAPKALFHTDAVQAFLKLPIDVKKSGVHMLTLSGHKLHAPKGVGALYIKSGVNLPPLLFGGGQEGGRRAGTEALPLIAAFAEAVNEGRENFAADNNRMTYFLQTVKTRLISENPGLAVIGSENKQASPHILCVSLPGYRSEVLMNFLENREIYVSKGSACKRGRRSHVLEAMGLPAEIIDSAIRISLSRYTTDAEINALCGAVAQARNSLIRSSR